MPVCIWCSCTVLPSLFSLLVMKRISFSTQCHRFIKHCFFHDLSSSLGYWLCNCEPVCITNVSTWNSFLIFLFLFGQNVAGVVAFAGPSLKSNYASNLLVWLSTKLQMRKRSPPFKSDSWNLSTRWENCNKMLHFWSHFFRKKRCHYLLKSIFLSLILIFWC